MKAKLHALQYMRAIASMAVVYSHAVLQVPEYQALLHDAGSFGVDIFFVISGFIMVYIAKPDDTPSNFISNRVRRVVPLYWFFTLLMAAILLLVPSVFKSTTFDLTIIVKSLLFIPHYSQADPSQVWPIVAPGWSLVYEMYFYALFAASLWFARSMRVWLITTAIAVTFVTAHMWQWSGAIGDFFQESIVFEFTLGMLLAVAWQRGLRLSSSAGYGLILVGFALLLIGLPMDRLFAYGIPSLLIVAGTLYCTIPNSRFFVLLGDASYALYLCHIFTLGICRKVLPPILGDGMTAALLFVVISLIACQISALVVHYLIDNWLLRHERLHWLLGTKHRQRAL